MNEVFGQIGRIFGAGLDPSEYTILHVCARAVVIVLAALIMVKLAGRRVIASKTVFDYVIGFVLASVLARAINGSAEMIPSIAAGFVVVGVQKIIAVLGFHSKFCGALVKGTPAVLVEKGQFKHEQMRRLHISKHDLEQDLRLNGKTDDVSNVRFAQVERNGEISVLRESRVVLLKVEEGVQYVHLHIDA